METPLKRHVLDTLKKQEVGRELLSAAKNPANCDAETSVVEIPTTPFMRVLGVGTGVQVMCIKRNHPTIAARSPWAIKLLSNRSDPSQKDLYNTRLFAEAAILKKLSHPNIVGYRAFDKLEDGVNFIALEYCTTSLGNILENRYNNREGPLEASKTTRMAIDVLRGLDYLHTKAHILHGDVKSFNILINDNFEMAKLCDFGVSLELDNEGFLDLQKNPKARYVGTGIWSAPEILEDDPTLISSKSDIFSFGLTIYETIVLMPPHTFPGIKDESIVNSAGYASLRAGVEISPLSRPIDTGVIEINDDDSEEEEEGTDELRIKRKLDYASNSDDESNKKSKPSGSSSPHEDCRSLRRKKISPEGNPPAENMADHTSRGEFIKGGATVSTTTNLHKIDESNPEDWSKAEVISISDSDEDEEIFDVDEKGDSVECIGQWKNNEDGLESDEEEEDINEDIIDLDEEDLDDEEAYDEEGYDEEDEDDGPYLNYGVLGSRPPIPSNISIDEEHFSIIELFYVCTEADPTDRPSAAELLHSLEKAKQVPCSTNDSGKASSTAETISNSGIAEIEQQNDTAVSTKTTEMKPTMGTTNLNFEHDLRAEEPASKEILKYSDETAENKVRVNTTPNTE